SPTLLGRSLPAYDRLDGKSPRECEDWAYQSGRRRRNNALVNLQLRLPEARRPRWPDHLAALEVGFQFLCDVLAFGPKRLVTVLIRYTWHERSCQSNSGSGLVLRECAPDHSCRRCRGGSK